MKTHTWILIAALFVLPVSAEPPDNERNAIAAQDAAPPAPAIDRVGFPKNYSSTFKLLGISRRNKEPAIMTVYGNDPVASVKSASQLPYSNGSIIIMEWANTLKDDEGTFVRDSKGEPRAGKVVRIDVMRRGKDFGEAYGANRAGEWEFASYTPNGGYLTPPEKSAECAACHAKAGPEKDFVFRLRVPGSSH
jgi:Cytochrome P460